ncbi:putative zinc finger, C3HC4 type (RING finger) [Lyophyllum shimeji]|uniref:RING-type E3 ubiquitin transferase n=1 Tax=Lyophyllum shimeji TaxID=47721 RepID=A0A9P3UN76_LYOSH|nr:putative zinc finger, C3HC4 type (RING finger) [Lyophyllum shimeji]
MMELDLDAHNHSSALRRVRSAGDVPRRPEPIHGRRALRYSDSRSDLGDPQPGQGWGSYATPTHIQEPSSSRRETGRRSTVIDVPSTHSQLETLDAPTRRRSRPRRTAAEPIPPPSTRPRGSLYVRVMTFLGLGGRATRERKSLVGLFLNLASGSVQIIVITVILGLTGTKFKSPTQPDVTEWVACSRPLGIWACIWVFRACLACGLNYWGFLRERQTHRRRAQTGSESQGTRRSSSLPSGNSSSSTPHVMDHDNSARDNAVSLPYTVLYSRLTLLSSLLTLSWFLTAHILEYTSINTCRHSSPHLWWLTFGILCLMYLMVLEVVILGFIVFIVAPILFVFWNIVLICIGRHPWQSNAMINPDIGKLPKSIVDRIPLVMYIPPPPDTPVQEKVAIPEPIYGYPPKPAPATPPSKPRFRFMRRFSSFQGKKGDNTSNTPASADSNNDVEKAPQPQTWEAHWEQGEYPFVVLEGNRAACAICLMDFEEPKRIGGAPASAAVAGPSDKEGDSGSGEKTMIAEVPKDSTAPTTEQLGEDELKLADAGEGAQPLRLLTCGHVFHKTCLDPWLTDVSGRCPVCQRAVEIPKDKKPKKERRPNGNR